MNCFTQAQFGRSIYGTSTRPSLRPPLICVPHVAVRPLAMSLFDRCAMSLCDRCAIQSSKRASRPSELVWYCLLRSWMRRSRSIFGSIIGTSIPMSRRKRHIQHFQRHFLPVFAAMGAGFRTQTGRDSYMKDKSQSTPSRPDKFIARRAFQRLDSFLASVSWRAPADDEPALPCGEDSFTAGSSPLLGW